jgi:hypothetical protein
MTTENVVPIKAHSWPRHTSDFYVEPPWCSDRLFDEEPFVGSIYDPACGGGNIIRAAEAHGYPAAGSDIEDRGWLRGLKHLQRDFFSMSGETDNIVTNPPFKIAGPFFHKARQMANGKVAMILPTARLHAAWSWLEGFPLRTIWLMTPRPSMPPGSAIAAGQKVGGGWTDYCWIVWQKSYFGRADIRWLHRDRSRQESAGSASALPRRKP